MNQPAKEKSFPVKLLKNYRPDGMEKQAKGALMVLPMKEAKAAIKAGIAERNDPID